MKDISLIHHDDKKIIARVEDTMLKLTGRALHMKYKDKEDTWVRLNFDFEDLILQNQVYAKIFPVRVSLKTAEDKEACSW